MKSLPTELPPAPTTFTIASLLTDWTVTPAAMCGIVGVTALLNYLLEPLNSYVSVSITTALAFLIAFVMGGFFRNKYIGRATTLFLGIGVCIIGWVGFQFGRGPTVLPLLKTTDMDLGIAVSIARYFSWWVVIAVLISRDIGSKQVRLLHLRFQKITLPLRNVLAVCGVIFIVLICFVPSSAFERGGLPFFLYTGALQERTAAYQKEHSGWQTEKREGIWVQVKASDTIGPIRSSANVLQGASQRLISGPYSIYYNKYAHAWLVETHPRQSHLENSEDYFTHILVRVSAGLVLARW